MADTINVNYEEMSSVVSQVGAEFQNLHDKIDVMKSKCNSISEFWESSETQKFTDQLDKVSQMFAKFDEEYNVFISSLDIFSAYYQAEYEAFVNSLK